MSTSACFANNTNSWVDVTSVNFQSIKSTADNVYYNIPRQYSKIGTRVVDVSTAGELLAQVLTM